MTIVNALTKKSGKLSYAPRIYIYIYIYRERERESEREREDHSLTKTTDQFFHKGRLQNEI